MLLNSMLFVSEQSFAKSKQLLIAKLKSGYWFHHSCKSVLVDWCDKNVYVIRSGTVFFAIWYFKLPNISLERFISVLENIAAHESRWRALFGACQEWRKIFVWSKQNDFEAVVFVNSSISFVFPILWQLFSCHNIIHFPSRKCKVSRRKWSVSSWKAKEI